MTQIENERGQTTRLRCAEQNPGGELILHLIVVCKLFPLVSKSAEENSHISKQ